MISRTRGTKHCQVFWLTCSIPKPLKSLAPEVNAHIVLGLGALLQTYVGMHYVITESLVTN